MLYLHVQLEAVEGVRRRRMEKRAVGRRGEDDEQVLAAADDLGQGLAATAELQDHRLHRVVAVVDRHVIL